MLANHHDLAPRGDYFAERDYMVANLATGVVRNRAGVRMLALTDDFIVAALNALDGELGAASSGVVSKMGREWGRRAADQFAEEIGAFRGRTLSELPLAMYCADLTQAFRRHGWGVFDFDLSRYCDGILVVHVQDPIIGGAIRSADRPVDRVLQAFLAGMFSRFANEELDCLQTEFRGDGDSRCRFVITKAERIREVADGVGVRTHGELIEQLARR